ncbi:MAG: type II toxin-antitoxin system Phd/YefM family antitoxin [Brevundimonas sp.]|uniref:type II toxin-antitoxin system Phd/YefM family antitoxin n=1 Tax=Brevundimonas sp. TaxID=1871086 RepID=UPI001A1F6222|nr:type II toxin-antitoxin system Phd/YefM family antitoxin [Brevundimonas sp.]MBJ7448362.1 type II toxin-antitoxin system Phd/YefM family antitoxin [Brevundimonas sp.]
MIEVTMTELRRDLFRLIDRMAETGEPLRVKRHGRAVDLTARTPDKTVAEMTPQERWARFVARPPLAGFEDVPDDLDTYDDHWTWDPDTKFADLNAK